MTMSPAPMMILAPFILCAFLATLAGVWQRTLAYAIAIVGGSLGLVAAGYGLFTVLDKGTVHYFIGGWPPPFGIEYILAPLSAFMAIIVVFVGCTVLIFPPKAGLYQTPRSGVPMYGLLMLLLSGLIGVVVTVAQDATSITDATNTEITPITGIFLITLSVCLQFLSSTPVFGGGR